MKFRMPAENPRQARRSLHGERGLKYRYDVIEAEIKMSLPSRGAWIEIVAQALDCLGDCRRSLHGERGLKLYELHKHKSYQRRSLHGERGLKSYLCKIKRPLRSSLPSRGAWIEILYTQLCNAKQNRRSLHGERGLK